MHLPRILLVEFDDLYRIGLALQLRQEGYDVVDESNPEEGLAALRTSKFDLLITHLHFGYDENGGRNYAEAADFCRQAIGTGNVLRIIYLGSTVSSEDKVDEFNFPKGVGVVDVVSSRTDTIVKQVADVVSGESISSQ
jgi:CheY-like chemotaxis protein